jgi:hypothetical protein
MRQRPLENDTGGVKACSRWLSNATPPDNRNRNITRTPAGVPADRRHALHPHQLALSPRVCHQASGTRDFRVDEIATPRVSGRRRSWTRWNSSRDRGCRRSCPPARRAQADTSALGLYARTQEGVFRVDERNRRSTRFPLARGVCGLFGERVCTPRRSGIHCQTRGASSCPHLSGRIDFDARKKRGGLRRTISGLSRRGLAENAGTPAGVLMSIKRNSGGVASLDHRLQAFIPPGWRESRAGWFQHTRCLKA